MLFRKIAKTFTNTYKCKNDICDTDAIAECDDNGMYCDYCTFMYHAGSNKQFIIEMKPKEIQELSERNLEYLEDHLLMLRRTSYAYKLYENDYKINKTIVEFLSQIDRIK